MDWTAARYLGLLACFALLVASCGAPSNTADDGLDEADRAGSSVDDDVVPAELGFDASNRSLDGELRLALARPVTYLPFELSPASQEAMIVADLLYDGLTEADPTESTLRPALATTWSANDNATEWTFTLDTDRVQPDAVVAHIESLREVAIGTTAVVLDQVDGVAAVDGDAVRFTLDGPNAGFPWLLSGVAFSVVGEGGEPTGRYEVAVDDEEMLLLEAEGGDRPDITVEWHDTARDAYNRLTVGAVDAAVVPPDALEDARSRYGADPPARAISRFYVVNHRSERLFDSELRVALLAAVDRTTLVADAVDAPAFALDGILAPTLIGYERSGCGRVCTHDPDRAAQLVRDATPSGPSSTELRIGATLDQEPIATALAADLDAVGLSAVVLSLEPSELAAAIASGEVDLFSAGWIAPASSLDATIPLLLAEDSPVGIGSPVGVEVRALLDKAAGTLDDDTRWALLADAHAATMTGGSVLPVAIGKSYFISSPESPAIPIRADGTIDLIGVE